MTKEDILKERIKSMPLTEREKASIEVVDLEDRMPIITRGLIAYLRLLKPSSVEDVWWFAGLNPNDVKEVK